MSSSRDPLIEQRARPEALLSDSQRQKYFSEFFQLFFYRRRIVWFNNASEIFMRHGETHRARACLTSNKLSDNFIVSEGLIDQIRSLSASADSQRYTRGNQLIELKIKPRMSLFHGLLRESQHTAQVHYFKLWRWWELEIDQDQVSLIISQFQSFSRAHLLADCWDREKSFTEKKINLESFYPFNELSMHSASRSDVRDHADDASKVSCVVVAVFRSRRKKERKKKSKVMKIHFVNKVGIVSWSCQEMSERHTTSDLRSNTESLDMRCGGGKTIRERKVFSRASKSLEWK